MRSLLYLIAIILVIGWLVGFFIYSATGLIHILLIPAFISLILAVIRRAWSVFKKIIIASNLHSCIVNDLLIVWNHPFLFCVTQWINFLNIHSLSFSSPEYLIDNSCSGTFNFVCVFCNNPCKTKLSGGTNRFSQ